MLAPQLLEEPDDLISGVLVEVACRLVGQDHGRILDQGARNRDSLLLAAGKLRGQMLQPIAKSDALECLRGLVAARGRPEVKWHKSRLDVLLRAEGGYQVERLEDEADRLAHPPS